ncbi:MULTISPECIES: thioesterase domain-containing protein [unclassified Bradyrhizobium]|uniref:thioesterase domain-containing protein n=1 Tax=unclassified Bradyrhizobium TaxID=2631580 RepID=UPI0023066EDA|nr:MULTISPECIES: thioesterase domain-containing protein [unclassified Bradyrhizobium]MDA9408885.1 hypothetical protein [Bradyrhizobium sp. CCBAU 45384]
MARIAYGHPSGNASDFLDYWLERKGWGLVAATYPGDHPALVSPKSDLDLESWASALATLVAETVGQDKGRPIIAAGWSMGGKLAFALTRALRLQGQELECFVSLCATPPFPRTDDSFGPPERLAPNGLWDLSAGTRDGLTRDERWLQELVAIAKAEGHTVIAPDMFGPFYRTNVPPGLWGPELAPFFNEEVTSDLPGAFLQACSFSGVDYPICAAIIPMDSRDYRHALADEAVWGSITIKSVLHNVVPKLAPSQLSTHDWLRLRDRVVDLPRRLARYLPGGHFFFVGAHGARATVSHLEDLHEEIRSALDLFGSSEMRIGNT